MSLLTTVLLTDSISLAVIFIVLPGVIAGIVVGVRAAQGHKL